VLENWQVPRVVNGAFIQLPETNRKNIQHLANYYEYRNYKPSVDDFRYESRYGKNGESEDAPPSGLTFGRESCWAEIQPEQF